MTDPTLNELGMTELHSAAYQGEADWVENCLAGGLSVRARDSHGCTPLHWAADMGMADGDRELVAASLILAGSDVNARDKTGRSVLEVARLAGNEDIVRQLIAAGAVETETVHRPMPDNRKHRGPHPEDAVLFAPKNLPALRQATEELSWLLTRGFPPAASLKLVGDRHRLVDRQRIAVSRAACSDQSRERRAATRVVPTHLAGERLLVDGFNLLITVEAALSGGVLLLCRDSCTRDLASMHGSYRSVEETEVAIRRIGETLTSMRPARVEWLLDRPVSNSGRLAARIEQIARKAGWPWSVETVFDPDAELAASDAVVASSDSGVLDRVRRWAELTSPVVEAWVPVPWQVDLRDGRAVPKG